MDKQNPTGSGSFSLNRKEGTDIGDYSFAEGGNTTASSYYSHAEGYQTTASGWGSHSEGFSTIASGVISHAEGYQTTASGRYSHAEGFSTIASGICSHAEGSDTVASGNSQHVFGRRNIADTADKYVEIVGNGDEGLSPSGSNARTLDWSGNEYLAGNLQAAGLTDGTTTKTMTEVLAGGFKITMRWY